MMDWRRYSERMIAATMALALQAGLYLLLMPSHPLQTSPKTPRLLVTMILNAVRPRRAVAAPPPASALIARKLAMKPLVVRPISPPKLQVPASGPAVDWAAAIRHQVGAELSPVYTPPKPPFGFPRMPAKEIQPPTFKGWDEVRIHRAQRLANGIIDIGRCVINLSFPIPLCQFGRTPADGNLFKQMHADRTAVGSLP